MDGSVQGIFGSVVVYVSVGAILLISLFKFLRQLGLLGAQPITGVGPGKNRAQLGVWSYWTGKKDEGLLQVTLKYVGSWRKEAAGPVSWTCVPMETVPSFYSLDYPLNYRELLVGAHRAMGGEFELEVRYVSGATYKRRLPIAELRAFYWAENGKADYPTKADYYGFESDAKYQGDLTLDQLGEVNKAAIQKAKELEEKRLKEAEERRKQAEAAKLAASGAKPKLDRSTLPPLEIGSAKVGLFYGSSTGNTATIADMIKEQLGASNVMIRNVTQTSPKHFEQFQCLVLGVPTWNTGEMQDDWADLLPELKNVNLKGKKIAIFGLGDYVGYGETYVTAMKELWDNFKPLGAQLVGYWPTAGYQFQKTTSIENGKFIGLVIDIENQNNLTPSRVKTWCGQIKSELGI